MLFAALSPGAFIQLAEEGGNHEKTGEMNMLEQSRNEGRVSVKQNAKGWARVRQRLYVFWYCYIYDPVATGFRFLHLVTIFAPVILTFPALWIGRRVKDKNGLRTGAVWWYHFLVKAMQRAGPAFIKVT